MGRFFGNPLAEPGGEGIEVDIAIDVAEGSVIFIQTAFSRGILIIGELHVY